MVSTSMCNANACDLEFQLKITKIFSLFCIDNQITSSPLSAAKRLQFSMDVEPVAKFEPMSKLPRVIIPLMWVEESCHLNATWTESFSILYT